jgi:hypothetical protein
MIPGKALTPTPQYTPFLYPDNIPVYNTTDYQLGGIGLSDPSEGLQVQAWFLELSGTPVSNNVVISAPNQQPLILFSAPFITQISLAFDQNMKAAVAYVSQGNSFLWWYDATIPGYTTVSLPAGTISPRCTLDDKRQRELNLGLSDIILAYIYNHNLCYRQERDRFLIEYVLYPNVDVAIPNPTINKIGMNSIERLQFQIFGNLYQ